MNVIRLFSVLFLAGMVILAGIFHFLDWNQIESVLSAIPYRCPLKWVIGYECAFCGMTHAWIAMLKGEWGRAFHFNRLGPLLWAGSILIALALSWNIPLEKRFRPWMAVVAMGILAAYAVIRNL